MKRFLVCIVLVVVAAGCARIPHNGSVQPVHADRGTADNAVRYTPAGPPPNADPAQIVSGYLDAMLAYPVSTGTAASFLTPEAAKSWESAASVRIYTAPEIAEPVKKDSRVSVVLKTHADSTLDRNGRFTSSDRDEKFMYHVKKVHGQWRITNPQDGLLVNRKFFDDYYRPFNVYYFDAPGKRLVAEPIHLPMGEQLSTALMKSLVTNQQSSVDRGTRSYAPKDMKLASSVPVDDDGLADVTFKSSVGVGSQAKRQRFSAQIIWTLRQVAAIANVRITIGANVVDPGNRGIQSVDSWAAFGPSSESGSVYGLLGNKVVQVTQGNPTPVNGPWGTDARKAARVAVGENQIAAIDKARTTLVVGDLDGKRSRTYRGKNLLDPRWAGDGRLWVVDSPKDAARVRVSDGKKISVLKAPELAAFQPTSFSLSPDLSRYAFTAIKGGRSRIYVGDIVRNSKDVVTKLGEPEQVRPRDAEYSSPHSVVWATSTSLAFLAKSDTFGTQMFFAAIDGAAYSDESSSTRPLLPDVNGVDLTTTGGQSPSYFVTDDKNRVWQLGQGAAWHRLKDQDLRAITSTNQ